MKAQDHKHRLVRTAVAGLALAHTALGGTVLYTVGSLGNCLPGSAVTVEALQINFDYGSRTIDFTIAGTSTETLNVTAYLNLLVYGKDISATPLNPCEKDSFVSALCPSKSEPSFLVIVTVLSPFFVPPSLGTDLVFLPDSSQRLFLSTPHANHIGRKSGTGAGRCVHCARYCRRVAAAAVSPRKWRRRREPQPGRPSSMH